MFSIFTEGKPAKRSGHGQIWKVQQALGRGFPWRMAWNDAVSKVLSLDLLNWNHPRPYDNRLFSGQCLAMIQPDLYCFFGPQVHTPGRIMVYEFGVNTFSIRSLQGDYSV